VNCLPSRLVAIGVPRQDKTGQAMLRKRLLGCAHRFRPTYARANVGHPSISFEVVKTYGKGREGFAESRPLVAGGKTSQIWPCLAMLRRWRYCLMAMHEISMFPLRMCPTSTVTRVGLGSGISFL
jgi:hypothetical protein